MVHGPLVSLASGPASWPLAQATPSIWLTPAQWLSVALMVGGMLVLVWACRGRQVRSAPVRPRPAAAHPMADDPPSDPDPRSVVHDAEELLTLLAEQADHHAERLQRLIADADARIRRLEHLEAAPARHSPDRPARADRADPLNQQIYALSDEGLPPVEIARKLEQQTGKVELVLALRRR
ncbi:MAG: hypothetical protein WD749_14245 [Phycisphaerales bacterium]